MTRLFISICAAVLLLFTSGMCFANLTNSDNVVLIDTEFDDDIKVEFEVYFFDFVGAGYKFGFLDPTKTGDQFAELALGTCPDYNGGDIFNFAIRPGAGTVLSLEDGNGSVLYIKERTGDSAVEEPDPWSGPWYDHIVILWHSDPAKSILTALTVLTTDGNPDGFSSTHAPIPPTAFLFLSGVIGLVGIRRKFMK